MSSADILSEFGHLHLAEQIQLVEDMWDQIAQRSDACELTDAQKSELLRRKAEVTTWPPQGSSWEEVKSRLLKEDA